MSFENHWGPVDETACLPQERVHELSLMVTTSKPPVAPRREGAREGREGSAPRAVSRGARDRSQDAPGGAPGRV